MFKAGDSVRFKGLAVGNIVLAPREGVLRRNDKNTTIRGVVSILEDKDALMFCPDGSMYCHSQHGVLLEAIPDTEVARLLKKLE